VDAPIAQGAFADQRTAWRISSTALFRGRQEVVIIHGRNEYRLRITKADKLILTK
jgi:hemin uptake protein HemP